MDESELIFSFFYILLCACIVYPPTEFVSLGLTLDQVFANVLGLEEMDFVRYHQKRTSLTIFAHASLPALYFIIHFFRFSAEGDANEPFKATAWNLAQRVSLAAALFIPTVIARWAQNDWKHHPISKLLNKFANLPNGYAAVAADIASECRRQDVLRMEINSITSVIATENWIIKTTPYFVYFAHQSDTTLQVNKTETFAIAQDTSDSVQMINIAVTSSRPGVNEFQIRINALDFKTLQDRINRPITIPPNMQFHRTIMDRFIDAFKEQIAKNPIFQTNQVLENCFACMLAEPNIKIQKNCLDVDEDEQPLPEDRCCKNCYCRPMWCADCLARWFASRQDIGERDIWLQKKCTCPLCRATFCVLDVCFVEKISS